MAKSKASVFLDNLLGINYFPHQLSFLIDNPFRRLIISPQTLVKRLSLKSDSRVLEIGAGSGYFSLEIARQIPFGHLEIFDLQEEMLAKARLKIEKAKLENVGYTKGDASNFQFPADSFDAAILVTVLGEIPDPKLCLRSLLKILRPNGQIAVHEHLPDPDFINLKKLRALVEKEGYVFQKAFGFRLNYTAIFSKC